MAGAVVVARRGTRPGALPHPEWRRRGTVTLRQLSFCCAVRKPCRCGSTASSRAQRQIAELLDAHPAVDRVYYPGLANAPQLAVHRAQASGDGAVLSFVTGDPEFSRTVVEATKLFAITVSFGGVNSTISLPNYMSHASIPAHLRQQKSIPADLVRVSVGAEDVDDLIDDLNQALEIRRRQPSELARRAPRLELRKGARFRLPSCCYDVRL